MGRNSLQYKVVRKLSHALASGIQDGFVGVVGQALQKGLITSESHQSLTNLRQPVLDRATHFISVILEKIELDAVVYDKFVGILRSDEAWHLLVDKMDKELSDSGFAEGDYSATIEACETTVDGQDLATPTSTKGGISAEPRDSQDQRREGTAQEEGISRSATKETLPVPYGSSQSALIIGNRNAQPHCSSLGQIKDQLDTVFEEKDRTISDLSREVTEGKEREKKLKNEMRLVQQQKEDMQRRLEISEEEKKKAIEEKEAAVKRYEKDIEKLRQRISQMEEENRQIVDDYKSQITDLNKEIASLNQLKENAELQQCKEEAKHLREIMGLKDKLSKVEKDENLLRIRVAEEQRRNAELETKYAKEKQQLAEEQKRQAEEQKRQAEEQKQQAEKKAELLCREGSKIYEEIQQLHKELDHHSHSDLTEAIEELAKRVKEIQT